MGSTNSPVLNLTIVSYILLPPVLLSSRPFNGPALDMGAERLRKLYNFNVTVKYIGSFNWSTADGMVENTYLLSRFFAQEWDRNGVVVLHAPGTNEVGLLGDIAREEDVLMLTTTFSSEGLPNFRRYPTKISTAPVQIPVYPALLFAVLNEFSWTSVCIIRDTSSTSPFYGQWITAAYVLSQSDAAKVKITMAMHAVDSKQNITVTLPAVLQQCSRISRVIVLSMRGDIVRLALIQATRLGMTNGEHVYFATQPLENARFFGKVPDFSTMNESENQIVLQAYRSLLKIAPCGTDVISTDKQDAFRSSLLKQWKLRSWRDYAFNYTGEEEPSEFVTATYDAMDVLGQLLNHSMTKRMPTSGRSLAARALSRSFPGETGNIFIDSTGERKSPHCVSDFDVNSRTFKPVVLYNAAQQQISALYRNKFEWPSGKQEAPPNEPFCGFTGNRCNSAGYSIVLVGLLATVASMTFIAFAGLVLYCTNNRNMTADRRSKTWWLITTPLETYSFKTSVDRYRLFASGRTLTISFATSC